LQARDELAQRQPCRALERGRVDDAVELRLGEAELVVVEVGMSLRRRLERVQMGHQMAALAIRLDEPVHAEDAHLAGVDDRLSRPAVADGVRGRRAVPVGTEVEAGEEDGPALVDRGRVFLPAAILLGDPVLVRQRNGLESSHGRSLLAGSVRSRHPSW
jgi:hypothetical protein